MKKVAKGKDYPSNIFSDEIDLTQIFLFFYRAKKEILYSILTLGCASVIFFYVKLYSFEFNVVLEPMSIFEFDAYAENNTNGFYQINKENVYSLFVALIKDKKKLKAVIKNSNLIKAEDYKSKIQYDKAITDLSSKIHVNPYTFMKNGKFVDTNLSIINFKSSQDDGDKTLKSIVFSANEMLRNILLARYENKVKLYKMKNNLHKEDLTKDINNLIDDYKRTSSDHIEFLKEQAKIARSLKISKNTLDTSNFMLNDSQVISSIKVDQPYYLHGYISIEKEIELIKTRQNDRAFIANLYDKEKGIRSIKQNMLVERSKKLIVKTPLYTKDKFQGINLASINDLNSITTTSNTHLLFVYLICSLAIGIFIGLMAHYVEKFRNELE